MTFQVQDSSSDVGYSPSESAQDWKALNRFTIARKVKFFDGCAMVIGLAGTPKKFWSLIDLNYGEQTLKQDITDITMVIRRSWQVRTTLENLNALCEATKTHCALMKIEAHLARRSSSVEKRRGDEVAERNLRRISCCGYDDQRKDVLDLWKGSLWMYFPSDYSERSIQPRTCD